MPLSIILINIILVLCYLYLSCMIMIRSILWWKPNFVKEPKKFIEGHWQRVFCFYVLFGIVVLLKYENAI